jgi:hypothetical protein
VEALVAALGCSLMMVVAVGAFAWYALRGRQAGDDADEVAALRAEIGELRRRHPGMPSDEPTERG